VLVELGDLYGDQKYVFVCYILVASIVVDRGRKECTGSCGGHYTF